MLLAAHATLMPRSQLILRVLAGAAVVLAILYAGDWLALRYRADPYGAVTVRRYYALHKSRGKVNFIFADPQDQTCVRSLFPHAGYTPCWYLSRHPEQRIDFE